MSGVFDAYAGYYDELYRDKDYAGEAAYVSSHIRRHCPKAESILELGCGTGAHAEHLARDGFLVHGVDISDRMVSGAKARQGRLATDIASRLGFEVGDARSVRTGRKYDVVVSLFHVMSYQVGNSDLQAVVSTAAEHLEPGGLFLFDYWYGPAVLSEKPSVRVKRYENESMRIIRIGEPDLRASENVVRVNYQVLIEEKKSGKLHEIHETHPMRYLFLPEVASMLAGSRLQAVDACEWMTSNPPSATTWNVCSVARAPE